MSGDRQSRGLAKSCLTVALAIGAVGIASLTFITESSARFGGFARGASVRPFAMRSQNFNRVPRTTGRKTRVTSRGSRVVTGDHGSTRNPKWPRRPIRIISSYPRIPIGTGPVGIYNGTLPSGPGVNQIQQDPNQPNSNQTNQNTAQRGGFDPPPPGETRFVRNEVLVQYPGRYDHAGV